MPGISRSKSPVSLTLSIPARSEDETLDATLTADGNQTILVVEIGNLPLEPLPYFGVGWQLHFEKLAAYLAGSELDDTTARWDVLVPAYQAMAAEIDV